MSIFSKKAYRAIKIILVSPQAELLSVTLRTLAILVLLFSGSIQDLTSKSHNLIQFQDKTIREIQLFNEFYKLESQTQDAFNISLLTLHNHFWSILVPQSDDEEKIISAVRLIQYTVDLPASCIYDDFSQLLTENEQSVFLQSLSSYCNPYNAETMIPMLPENLSYLDQELCLNAECSEFQLQDIYRNQFSNFIKKSTSNQIKSNSFGTYPTQGFIAEITFTSENDFKEKTQKLLDNQWITNTTLALAIQFNKYSKSSDTMIGYTLLAQQQFSIESSFEVITNQISMKPGYSLIWAALPLILLIANFFFIFKVIYEGSIAPRPTQVSIFLNCAIEISFAVLSMMESAEFKVDIKAIPENDNCTIVDNQWFDNGNFQYISPCFQYIIIDAVSQMQSVRLVLQAILLVFVPFNLFWIYSYMKGIELVIKFVNSIYRSTVQFIRLFLFRLIVFFSWALAFHIAFRKNFDVYGSYHSSLYCLIVWSIPSNEDEWYRGSINTGMYTNAFEICLLLLCRFYILIITFSFTSIALQAAIDVELEMRPQWQILNLETISSQQKKLEKFQKTYLSENEKNTLENSKLVAWLNKNTFSIEDIDQIEQNCQDNSIRLQTFMHISDLIQFLQFLFQIKPQLLFKSQIYFRIIVDLEMLDQTQTAYFQSEERQAEYISLLRLLYMLKDKGSRVPLLLNFHQNNRPTDSVLITFYKIYPYLYLNNQNIQMLKEFIFTENMKQWEKRTYVDDEENQEFEEEESDIHNIN